MVNLGIVSKNKNFALLWASHLTSSFGDGLRRVALPWLVYILTGSSLQLGISFALSSIPSILGSPITGYYVDKISRKKILFFSCISNGLVVLLIPVSATMDFLNIYLVYLVMISLSIASSFFYEARFSVIPDLVGEDKLDEANSFLYANKALISLFSVVLAGFLIEFIGIRFAFIFDSITFFAAGGIISLAAIPYKEKHVPKELTEKISEIFEENMTALREIRKTIVGKIVLVGFPLNIASVPFILVFTHISHEIFGIALALSALLIAESLGRLLGNYAVNKLPWDKITKCWAGILIMAVFALAFGGLGLVLGPLIPLYPLPILLGIALLVFLMYLGQPIMNVTSDSIVQIAASDEHRGKILSLSDALLMVPFPFAYLFGGFLLDRYDPFVVVLILGLILLLTGILARTFYRSSDFAN